MQGKTCHGCGLEDADSCPAKHQPSLTTAPCETCVRNPAVKRGSEHVKDWWNERWALDEENKPFIES